MQDGLGFERRGESSFFIILYKKSSAYSLYNVIKNHNNPKCQGACNELVSSCLNQERWILGPAFE